MKLTALFAKCRTSSLKLAQYIYSPLGSRSQPRPAQQQKWRLAARYGKSALWGRCKSLKLLFIPCFYILERAYFVVEKRFRRGSNIHHYDTRDRENLVSAKRETQNDSSWSFGLTGRSTTRHQTCLRFFTCFGNFYQTCTFFFRQSLWWTLNQTRVVWRKKNWGTWGQQTTFKDSIAYKTRILCVNDKKSFRLMCNYRQSHSISKISIKNGKDATVYIMELRYKETNLKP